MSAPIPACKSLNSVKPPVAPLKFDSKVNAIPLPQILVLELSACRFRSFWNHSNRSTLQNFSKTIQKLNQHFPRFHRVVPGISTRDHSRISAEVFHWTSFGVPPDVSSRGFPDMLLARVSLWLPPEDPSKIIQSYFISLSGFRGKISNSFSRGFYVIFAAVPTISTKEFSDISSGGSIEDFNLRFKRRLRIFFNIGKRGLLFPRRFDTGVLSNLQRY